MQPMPMLPLMMGLLAIHIASAHAAQTMPNRKHLDGRLTPAFDLLLEQGYERLPGGDQADHYAIQIRADGAVLEWVTRWTVCHRRDCAGTTSTPRIIELKAGHLLPADFKPIESALKRIHALEQRERQKPCVRVWTEHGASLGTITALRNGRMSIWEGHLCPSGKDTYAPEPGWSELDKTIRNTAAAMVRPVLPMSAKPPATPRGFDLLTDSSNGAMPPRSDLIQVRSDGWVVEIVGYHHRMAGYRAQAGRLSDANLSLVELVSEAMFALRAGAKHNPPCPLVPDAGSTDISLSSGGRQRTWSMPGCVDNPVWCALDTLIRNAAATALKPVD